MKPSQALPGWGVVVLAGAIAACGSISSSDSDRSFSLEFPSAAAAITDFTFHKIVGEGTSVDVRNINGPILVEASNSEFLDVVAVKSGRASELAKVHIVSVENAGRVSFCALWPGQDASSCGKEGRGGSFDDVHVRVEFRLRVPAKMKDLHAATMNGAISAKGLASPVALTTMNGAVDVETLGPISAETMNGQVTCRASSGKPVHLSTTNGSVTLAVPPSYNAEVEASTTNGRISSDFGDVPEPTIPALHSARITLGSGGTAVTMRTTNGNIKLTRP
jgi:hypothetical protein